MKPDKKPLVIAHRGFSGRHPENTLDAIEAAIRLKVDFVEIDVQETKDGEVIVFHDYGLKRLCGVRGLVRRTTAARIRKLNPLVPTFREALALCRRRTKLLVELKRADPAKVAALIEQAGMIRDVVVFSLSARQTAQFEKELPEVMRAGLVSRRLRLGLKRTQKLTRVQAVGLSRRLVRSKAVVDRLHGEGLRVFVWTVNAEEEMRRLVKWGVDGVITNWPDRLLRVLGRAK